MTDLEKNFNLSIEKIDSLKKKNIILTNDQLLTLYKYYKQAKIGDNKTSQPSIFNVTARAKWNAWAEVKGLPKEEVMQKYIDFVEELCINYVQ